ncbi:MAG: membrane or secreted protein [Bacteroidota bacterium]
MLKIVIVTIILVGTAFAGLGIRILLQKNGEFSGGNCQAAPQGLKDQGISCGCGGGDCSNIEETGHP